MMCISPGKMRVLGRFSEYPEHKRGVHVECVLLRLPERWKHRGVACLFVVQQQFFHTFAA